MNPDDLPSQAQTDQGLRALPSLAPKRRFKAPKPEEKDPSSVIVPFYNPVPKRARLTRSGQPFQVWTEPKVHRHDPEPHKHDLRTAIGESVQAYARSMAFLLSWRAHHLP
jgi:hypothetical protein